MKWFCQNLPIGMNKVSVYLSIYLKILNLKFLLATHEEDGDMANKIITAISRNFKSTLWF